MRGTTKPTSFAGVLRRSMSIVCPNGRSLAGVLRRSMVACARKGGFWESRVFGGLGSRNEGVWSFLDVWDQGEHPNVVFFREGSFWCTRIIGAATSSSSSSSE